MGKKFKACLIEGCNGNAGANGTARGLCSAHYGRWKRYGDPNAPVRTSPGEPLKWIMRHKDYQCDDCLIWPFSKMRNEYGHLQVNGKFHPAHRYMCEIVNGPPPTDRHEAAHSCGFATCVNPKHLRWSTPKENAADKIVHGTNVFGERRSFLSEREVVAMRYLEASGISQRTIAKAFNVTPQRVNEIVLLKAWKYAESP